MVYRREKRPLFPQTKPEPLSLLLRWSSSQTKDLAEQVVGLLASKKKARFRSCSDTFQENGFGI